MKKETLLQQAKKVKSRSPYKYSITDEHIELAFGWLKGEVGNKQINTILNKKSTSGNVLYAVATWLREAYKKNKLIIKL